MKTTKMLKIASLLLISSVICTTGWSIDIGSAEELAKIGKPEFVNTHPLNGNYELTESFSLEGETWKPIGEWDPTSMLPFTGKFDGKNHVISNLTIKRPDKDCVGLFGLISDEASVSNLILKKPTVKGRDCVGALVGKQRGTTGTIKNCSVIDGTVSGDGNVGGLVGQTAGTIEYSHAIGKVSGSAVVGGLAGASNRTINSYATGEVSGESMIGGLVGMSGEIIECSHAMSIVSGGAFVGGLVGQSTGIISKSYSTCEILGEVNGNSFGGLVGYQNHGSPIVNSYAMGMVSGGAFVGGLVGKGEGEIANSYATGNVSGREDVGGLIGFGFFSKGSVNNSYWNIETTEQTTSAEDPAGKNGRETVQMLYPSKYPKVKTYEDWPFGTIWKEFKEDGNYPKLKWQSDSNQKLPETKEKTKKKTKETAKFVHHITTDTFCQLIKRIKRKILY